MFDLNSRSITVVHGHRPPKRWELYTRVVNGRKGRSRPFLELFLLHDKCKKARKMRRLPYTEETLAYADDWMRGNSGG